MGYSGADGVRNARESLGKALEALQQEADVPEEVLGITQNVARAISALFEAQHASTEPDGKTCVKSALGTLSQTLALLQDVKSQHAGVLTATESIADVISILFPLTNKPSSPPRSGLPKLSPIPMSMLPPPAPKPKGERRRIEANLGATTQSNFYVGFSAEIAHGGVFLATYEALAKDTSVSMLVTLPGGFEFECDGYVRFVRDPMDFASESEPGMGIQFEELSTEARELALRFVRQRPPMFYDV